MNLKKQNLIGATIMIVAFGGTAHAQYYAQPAPLYPYVSQQGQYVYPQPQYAPQSYPYVQSSHVRSVPRQHGEPRASEPDRKVGKTDPVLVEQLRKRHKKKDVVLSEGKKDIEIDKKRVVREKPIVRTHIRVVDDPPIVVQREINEQGQVLSEQRLPTVQAQVPAQQLPPPPAGGRVIHAEAEVTILGPDRMSIRLYRKNDGRDANAKALPAKHKKSSKNEQPET
jgi:hypothetical protein